MPLEFATQQLDAQPIVGIRMTTTTDKLAEIMGPLFGEVYGYIQHNGQQPAGMPLSIYHRMEGGPLVDAECAQEDCSCDADAECAQEDCSCDADAESAHPEGGHELELECAVPVHAPMEGTGRVQPSELPTCKAATVTHLGPYDDLPKTWSALTQWMGSQGLQPAAAPWEVYVTDPTEEPDQSKWRTDIFFPVQ